MNKLIAVALFMISNTASAQMAMNDPNYPAYSHAIDEVSRAWFRVSDTNAWDVGNSATNGTDKVACMQALDELAAARVPSSTMMEIRSDTPDARHKLVSHTMVTFCGDPPNKAYR